jgi:putative oxidoreductase
MLQSLGLLVLRVGVGGMMAAGHGWDKLLTFGARSGSFPDPLGVGSELSLALAVFAELLCSIFLMLGLATRFAAVPALITMLTAAFFIHGDDPWAKKELALLYAVPFLTLLLAGGGRYSVDALLSSRRRPRTIVT